MKRLAPADDLDSRTRKPTRKPEATEPSSKRATPSRSPSTATGGGVIAAGWSDLDEDAYHGDPCPTPSLSSHVAIQVIQKSLLHAWRAHPRSPDFAPWSGSGAADRGSAAHALLFGGRQIRSITADDYRTSAARQARDEARTSGLIPVLEREVEALEAMAGLARPRFAELHGEPYLCEQSALWRAPGGGWRRARMDTLSASRCLIVDYKTTEAAVDAQACERRIADGGLHIQAAAYVDAVETLHPHLAGRVRFAFQWQEQKAPFALSPPIEMSEAFLSLGHAQWRAAGSLWDKALRHNAFPGYSSRPFLACPPPWELTRWEERLAADAEIAEGVS